MTTINNLSTVDAFSASMQIPVYDTSNGQPRKASGQQLADFLEDQIGANGTYPVYLWTSKPAASTVASGTIIRIADVGVSPGILVISDGTRWVPMGNQLLARNAAGLSVTGTTVESILATVTIPTGLMGLNGGLLVLSSWTTTNSANNKTLRLRLGGISGTQFMAIVNTASASTADMRSIRNRGTAASQVGSAPIAGAGIIGSTANALPTAALDTTQNQDLVLTGQLALGSETITLADYEVWASA